jgi:uncharacterized membrane protein YbhN (UPF0104 family)
MSALDEVSAQQRAESGKPASGRASTSRALLPWLRTVAAVAALVLAGLAAYSSRHQLAETGHLLGRINSGWLGVAIVTESASMIAFARLQRWLLRAGGVNIKLPQMVEITLAANALGTSLPGGVAWSATWAYAQVRRRGADRVLTVWVILVGGVLASSAIYVLLALGSWLASGSGPAASLWPVTTALAAIPVAAGVVWYASRRYPLVLRALHRSRQMAETKLPGAPWLGNVTAGLMRRIATVQPGSRGWLEAFGLAAANWIWDAASLTASLLALHVHVPWADIIFIYSLTQVAASLPITPGGLGVVEGSLALLLSAYGVPAAGALAGTLLYRIISFWGLVFIGWVVWLAIEAAIRADMRSGPHPWAIHAHGAQHGRDTTRLPDRVMRPSPCLDCDGDAVPVGAPGSR